MNEDLQVKLDAATEALRLGELALKDAIAAGAQVQRDQLVWLGILKRIKKPVTQTDNARAFIASERTNFINGR
jgi:hypothetical protein